MTEREIIQRGNRIVELFSKAVDSLQKAGYETELWVSTKHDTVMLRWGRKEEGSWHVTNRGCRSMLQQLESLGRHANFWLVSRERGLGNEANYAVKEN